VPIEPLLALIVVAVVANLVVMAVLVASPGTGLSDEPSEYRRADRRADPELVAAAVVGGSEDPTDESLTTRTYDRVVRIVSWIFLLATTVIVAVSGLWPENQAVILVILALAGLFVLVVHDLLPAGTLGTAKFVLEGSVAVTFATLLVVLTGRDQSPFFFTFPLIVGAGALLVAPRIALILAILATAAYLAAGMYVNPDPQTTSLVQMAVNLTGLYLLAYIGASVGREQRRARDAAIRMSTLDALTGLYNRSYFFTALEREIARGDRSGRAFCMVMLDLDDLKSVNDRYGHVAGDQVLRNVADIVRGGVRKIDVAARYGGDEFVALLPETDPTGGWVLAEKVRLTVAEQGFAGIEPQPTVSVGVVSYPADGRSADALLVSADRAMYASKRGGKNRVARATAEPMVLPIEGKNAERAREADRAG
jgi:diguanylate cyclase (GGDEF)-like protein